MLAAADAQIVAHDLAVPGLSLLLDDAALTEAIAEELPALDLDRAQVDYVRYKSGTSCLARIRLLTSSGEIMAYAVAHRCDARDKLDKAIRRGERNNALPAVFAGSAIVFYCFPFDRRLPSLARAACSSSLREFLRRASPQLADGDELSTSTLRYKPERRYVAQLMSAGRPIAALKMYSADSYPSARSATKTVGSMCATRWPRCIGHSNRHATMVYEWVDGAALSTLVEDSSAAREAFCAAGRALGDLHAQRLAKLPAESLETTQQRMRAHLAVLRSISDNLADISSRLWQGIHARLRASTPTPLAPIHGDLHLDQILVSQDTVRLLDFDRARLGDPVEDLGTLYADLVHRQTGAGVGGALADALFNEFLVGYAAVRGDVALEQARTQASARLLLAAAEPFRHRHPAWPAESKRLLDAAELLLEAAVPRSRSPAAPAASKVRRARTPMVPVTDPFGLATDNLLLGNGDAINPAIAVERLSSLSSADGDHSGIELTSIRVLRHKPGRRCLIEYSGQSRTTGRQVAVLGKIDAKGRHERHFERQLTLWSSGFDADTPDCICVARPWGLVPEWMMWLQEKVDGGDTWALLREAGGPHLGRRIARALVKLHSSKLPAERTHRMGDEIAVLRDRLVTAARGRPQYSARIRRLLTACERLATACVPNRTCPVHRDFYPDQVLAAGQRLTLVDFDLFCGGDPAVDAGNFRGHLVEHSLRCWRYPNHYAAADAAFLAEYRQLCPHVSAASIDTYTLLSLARHVFLTAQLPGRGENSPRVLELCEQLVHADIENAGGTPPDSTQFVCCGR